MKLIKELAIDIVSIPLFLVIFVICMLYAGLIYLVEFKDSKSFLGGVKLESSTNVCSIPIKGLENDCSASGNSLKRMDRDIKVLLSQIAIQKNIKEEDDEYITKLENRIDMLKVRLLERDLAGDVEWMLDNFNDDCMKHQEDG